MYIVWTRTGLELDQTFKLHRAFLKHLPLPLICIPNPARSHTTQVNIMSNLVSWASWASTSAANEASPDVEAPQDLIDLKQVALFDAIDRLGRLSLASDVEYPQLVVVGDQSCGKSSVLETIRRFHFPVSKEVWYVEDFCL